MDSSEFTQLGGLVVSFVALIVSVIALGYTVWTYYLKSGHYLRCDISTMSTVECKDNFISSITLENLKDRATVIFEIYYKISYNNYLLIESFENAPLILRPFEVYHKEYDPILYYDVGTDLININHLLDDRKIKRTVIVSTTDGKYHVNANTKHWSPISQFFKNYSTAIINPRRLTYKEKSYGSNVKYLIRLRFKDSEQVIPILANDYEVKKFRDFSLTAKSLETKESLKRFLQRQKTLNKLFAEEFEVLDWQEIVRKNENTDIPRMHLEGQATGFFQYYVIGRIYTIIDNVKMNRLNRRNKQKKT